MNSCVCTEDTRYADVAAQLFTAKVSWVRTYEVKDFRAPFDLGCVNSGWYRACNLSTAGAGSTCLEQLF